MRLKKRTKRRSCISSHLENVEVVHRHYPRTFSIPRRHQREQVQIGQLVKLVFLIDAPRDDEPRAERMWVAVEAVHPTYYIGTLANQPGSITQPRRGDQIVFGPEHVAALYRELDELPLPRGQFAWVSRAIVDDVAWPQVLYRDVSSDTTLSGWWVLSENGGETPLPDSIVRYSIDLLIEQFGVLDSVLDEPPGTRWRWNAEAAEYQQEG